MFRELLRYKLERQGKQLLEVDRLVPTTKVCSACGAVNETLSIRARRWVWPRVRSGAPAGMNAASTSRPADW